MARCTPTCMRFIEGTVCCAVQIAADVGVSGVATDVMKSLVAMTVCPIACLTGCMRVALGDAAHNCLEAGRLHNHSGCCNGLCSCRWCSACVGMFCFFCDDTIWSEV